MSFPENAQIGDIYTLDSRPYIWDGFVWKLHCRSQSAELVTSVAGKTGAVTLEVSDVSGAMEMPTYENWTLTNLPAPSTSTGVDTKTWRSIAYGNGVFVAVQDSTSDNNSTTAATSTDGTTWTTRTLPAGNWRAVGFGNGIFVALASRSATATTLAATSTDGVTWTQRTRPAGDYAWSKIAFGNGVFVATIAPPSTNTNVVMTTTDGITWTQRTLPQTGIWNSVAFGANVFVAIGRSTDGPQATRAATSPDGVTWTQRTLPSAFRWSDIAYGRGKFVVIHSLLLGPGQITPPIAISIDRGLTWSRPANCNLVDTNDFRCIEFGNGTFVAAGNSDAIYDPQPISQPIFVSSQDGITWSAPFLTENNLSVSYGSGTTLLTPRQLKYAGGKFHLLSAYGAAVSDVKPPMYVTFGYEAGTAVPGDDHRLSNPRPKNATAAFFAHGNSGAAVTLSATAAVQTCSLTADCAFTMPPEGNSDLVFILTQTGSFTATFSGVRWELNSPPTISTGAGKVDIIRFVSAGDSWYGMIVQNFS